MANAKDLSHLSIKHLPSNRFVKPVHYDNLSGEVSYINEDSKLVFTCFDYELKSEKGFDHLRAILNNLPANPKDFNSLNTSQLYERQM
jgi:hypothetical protein